MLDSYRDLIDDLLGTPKALRELVGGRTASDLPPASIALIAGLRDRDRTVLGRLQAMMREPDALLSALSETAPGPAPDDAAALLDELDSARGDLVSLLINLSLKDWARTATHAVDGEIALAEEVERHVEFDEAQVERIEATLA